MYHVYCCILYVVVLVVVGFFGVVMMMEQAGPIIRGLVYYFTHTYVVATQRYNTKPKKNCTL